MKQAIITSSLTFSLGVISFILGQLFLKLIIEPLSEYGRIKSRISQQLVFYADSFTNPKDANEMFKNEVYMNEIAESRLQLRKLASEYTGIIQIIPWYGLWVKMRIVPEKSQAAKISKKLIGLSNGLWSYAEGKDTNVESNEKRISEIVSILKLHQP